MNEGSTFKRTKQDLMFQSPINIHTPAEVVVLAKRVTDLPVIAHDGRLRTS